MSKLNIKFKLLNKTNNEVYKINTKAIKNNSKISFYDKDILNIIDIDNNYIERKNNEYSIKLDLNKEEGLYVLNDKFDYKFRIKKNYIKKDGNYIEFDYIIYMDEEIKYNFIIEYMGDKND